MLLKYVVYRVHVGFAAIRSLSDNYTYLNRNQTAKFLKVVVAFRYTETVIDVDGSGPIPPVAVRCEFFPDGRNITYVDHSQMESTRVRKNL